MSWTGWHGGRGALLAGLMVVGATPAAGQTPREIMDRVDRLMRGESSHGRVEMQIETEHWSRSLEMEVWSLGTDYSLVRVTAPAREAGTATLKADQEVWNYLPRVDRTIKVPPSLMMGSWMGSHFTNDDLVKESRIIDDYDIELSFDGPREGVPVWEFNLTPLPEAAVVWGHIEWQVRKADDMPIWVRYFDEDGALVRTLTFSDYKVMGGRLVPAIMLVVPTDKPAESTKMIYHDLEFGLNLTEDYFSLRNLRARTR
ncbi:MAG TPA: outer membrane lipoprotein-sorting protein [Longimicrobiales bacterium]|nr:outer membrane lipoprotein-sorting protein [Longimicrobiales bacterium]